MENINLENLKIEPFSIKHIEDVTSIHSKVLDGWSMKGLIGDLANQSTESYVAVYEGRALGFCSFITTEDAELVFICTHPLCRRQGVGEKLLREAIVALPKTVNSIVLEVRSQNEPAIKMYEKMGFVTLGKRKNFYSFPEDDAIVMELIKGGVMNLN